MKSREGRFSALYWLMLKHFSSLWLSDTGSSGFSIVLGLLLGKVEHQRAFFPWGKIGETGMESEGQEKC